MQDEAQVAWENARSICPGEEPKGIYLGCIQKEGTNYHFYRDGTDYYYETDYDREHKGRKKKAWKRAG